MGGTVHRFDAADGSTIKFPAALDGHYFAAEFGRRWLRVIDINSDGSAGQINEFPWRGTQIIDPAFGPDGALYVLAGDDNSGVFIGFPASSDPNTSINQGYEIQIDATDSPDRTTGSIYSFKSADIAARDAALNPPGEWNTFELLVEGERVQVFLNGAKINDFTNTDPARSLVSGHIGLQDHGTGDDVSFRNVRIRELGGSTPGTAGTADGTKIQLWTCGGGANQRWVTPSAPR